jgi:hypothetical protein
MRGEEGDTQYVPGACATEHQGGAPIAVLKASAYKCALVSSVNLGGLLLVPTLDKLHALNISARFSIESMDRSSRILTCCPALTRALTSSHDKACTTRR